MLRFICPQKCLTGKLWRYTVKKNSHLLWWKIFRNWQTSESALRFMNGLTLVCLVVWIFMLWFIDIFSYHHLQSCTYIDQCTFIRAEFSPVTPNKFIWAYQNRKIVLDLGSILYWVVRKFTKAAMNVKWSSVDIRKIVIYS